MSIDKRERAIPRDRRQPEGQLGQFNGERIRIDTVDAALDDEALRSLQVGYVCSSVSLAACPNYSSGSLGQRSSC